MRNIEIIISNADKLFEKLESENHLKATPEHEIPIRLA